MRRAVSIIKRSELTPVKKPVVYNYCNVQMLSLSEKSAVYRNLCDLTHAEDLPQHDAVGPDVALLCRRLVL